MKRSRLPVQEESDDDDIVLSEDEYEELKKDAAALTGTRYGGRSERVLQNNVPALLAKLEDLRLLDSAGKPLEWGETLVVSTNEPLKVPNIDDDLARETLIYNQTLASVHKALALCEEHGVKHQRPEDYYAEMMKTDDHMLKLKDHLLAEKRRKDERSQSIKERQMKKFAKKVQVETHLRRQKLKAEDMAVVKEWRKNQKRGASEEFPEELLDPKNKRRKELLEKAGPVKVGLNKSKKRLAKDSKYGNGGAKRFKKDNDVDSASDMSGFSRRRNAAGPRGGRTDQKKTSNGFPMSPQKRGTGGGFGVRNKKVATRRPGKDARAQRR